MTDLLIATTNSGKLREIIPILQETAYRLLTLSDIGRTVPEPEETGPTFADNARQKAAGYAGATGLMTVAEDSGLVIDALGGRPGILSARYPGETYPEKFTNLYKELARQPRPWSARYICAISLVQSPGSSVQSQSRVQGPASVPGSLFECEGVVEGEIWPDPRGSHGFGYDPIFYFPEYCATFGEVDDARKSIVAHRGRAFRKLRDFLLDPGLWTDPGPWTLD